MNADEPTTQRSNPSADRRYRSDTLPEPVITGNSLSKVYTRGTPTSSSKILPWRSTDDDRPTVTALEEVSISVHPGEIVGLAGPSGSGKSTLLHLLAGLEEPDQGTVMFDGTDLTSLSPRALRSHRLHNVGIVFQRFHLLEAFSARTNVALPLLEIGVSKRERRKRAATVLDRVGLGDRLEHKPGQLSGGEQQRVAIARALITEPPLVIADEPTGELDREAGTRVLDELEAVATDRAVVVASHDRQTLEAADRVIRLRDGQRYDVERAEVGAKPE